jgi:hypothetical protein
MPEGNLKTQAVEAVGWCVLSTSQNLDAYGLLPFGALKSPGVSEKLITWNTCQGLERAEGR